jgi:hypothetical protein
LEYDTFVFPDHLQVPILATSVYFLYQDAEAASIEFGRLVTPVQTRFSQLIKRKLLMGVFHFVDGPSEQ